MAGSEPGSSRTAAARRARHESRYSVRVLNPESAQPIPTSRFVPATPIAPARAK